MRKIEREMNSAIARRVDWSNGNTAVHFNHGLGSDVYLHGNHIARVDMEGTVVPNVKTIARWPTVTTRSRLRALGVNVYQKDYVTYINGTAV